MEKTKPNQPPPPDHEQAIADMLTYMLEKIRKKRIKTILDEKKRK
jgi:hypothetical protein